MYHQKIQSKLTSEQNVFSLQAANNENEDQQNIVVKGLLSFTRFYDSKWKICKNFKSKSSLWQQRVHF